LDHKLARTPHFSAWLVLGVAIIIGLALLIFTLLMHPPLSDIGLMCIFLTITALISSLVGVSAYQSRWIHKSPRLRITILGGYAVSSLVIFINVWITARLMFTSEHDLLLATVLLLFASGIAMTLGAIFSETLTERITALNQAAQEISTGQLNTRVPVTGRDELAQLASSFNAMASQLELAEKKKQEVDTLRRDLIAWVGHDLRTPLSSIRAIVEALADGLVEDSETTQRYLNTAKKDIKALSALIDDLFQMAQIDTGGLQLDITIGSISDLVSDTLESFSELARQQGIRLDGTVAPDIDPVLMDVMRIGRVLANLVDNAIRHTFDGGTVHIQAGSIPHGIRVEVSDSGDGIAPEDLPFVFERFYRGEKSRSRASGGAGLGLAIAKGIVEAHGGLIGVTSLPGKGTTFFFTLSQDNKKA